ncbi:MAG: 3-deoxy-D-manno-octulosonic-acid transferase [Gammaproteobacteria bacterium]|nr:3-deoxy-D-manno-octulosonic-acid transferase [Gammaproteobacteria bacterium]
MRLLYSFILYLLIPVVLLRLSWAGLKNRGYWTRWYERFGFIELPDNSHPHVWIHAVSVGEVQAAIPLIMRLKQDFPQFDVLVTTVTPTGSIMVRQRFGTSVIHTFLPYDLPDAVNRFLDRAKPRLLIVMETEIWPNLYYLCAARGIHILLANARLSEKSYRGYKKFHSFIRQVLHKISIIAAQSETDAARLSALGMDRHKIVVTGNLKFDVDIPDSVISQGYSIRQFIGPDRPVWIAASTHAGEEQLILAAQRTIIKRFPTCLLILAPRHPERCTGVAGLCREAGYKIIRKSQLNPNQVEQIASDVQIFLLDTIGELPAYYAAANVALVGGSLLPGMGGHNVLEPAGLGVPVLTGSHASAFMEINQQMYEHQAALQISDPEQLAEKVILLLGDTAVRQRMGEAGKSLVKLNQGSVGRVMDLVSEILSTENNQH